MKSFHEYLVRVLNLFSINEDKGEEWITVNGRHILIDPDGEIQSGSLKGTNIDDYGDNVEKKSKDVETVHHKSKFMDMPSKLVKKVEKHFTEMYEKVKKIVEKAIKTSSLPKELIKHMNVSATLEKVKKLLSSPQVIKMHSLQQELEETYKKLDKEKDPQKIKEFEDRASEIEDEIWDDNNKSAKEDYNNALKYCKDVLYTSALKKKGISCYTEDEIDIVFEKGFSRKRELKQIEKKAITTYTGSSYEIINGYLSNGASALENDDFEDSPLKDEAKMKKQIARMDKAIATSKLENDTTVLRGINPYEVKKLLSSGSYQNERFLSTTVGISTADKFGTKTDDNNKETRNILMINLPKGYNGLPVRDISDYRSENEILLPRNCNFKLKKKIVGEDGVTYYVVEPE